ncbi:MAG: PadR family transcriptional regulator [Candidatus Caldarchaeum sp.]|nr:PadR family transcriptional regulator [Candidatus Caldarchaeum sp.]MCS7137431.1 PadR family transcriptional regulator [Candidatus Caldarchaeum sp.]MDW7977377.1 PadR family transcriptional regulator [Candidatus Caldarchaeum sp.]MDW8360152.1 PadR family transcriptional regulator [Candidatus Caldarchaeum sp.]
MAYERLVRKLTHENLWLYVLTLLSRRPLYGYEVRSMIEKEFGFKPGEVTSYVVLYRLERSGLIKVVNMAKGSRGPSRKYYTITQKGVRTLEEAKRFLKDLTGRIG